jgi:hypothetical protein
MCVDYTDLNKHCPKDPFGLPRIDQVIDSTAGCDLLCFPDCYSGHHQIAIKEEDQEKTVFITPFGAYCYTTMSFGSKNADATYQRAFQACFKRQLNKNVEAYVDDVVVKTRNETNQISANGNPTLCTSVIVPRRGYHVQSLSQVVQLHTT